MGGWDEDGVTLLKRITSTLARNQGKDEGETAKFLVHRVSLAIQRGNAVFFTARLPEVVGEERDLLE